MMNGAEDEPIISEKEWFSSITTMTWSGGAIPKMLLAGTVRDTFTLWVTPPPLAVTVMLEVPTIAVLSAENVKVELPLPGAANELGLKLAVTPVGKPEADSDTAELKPPVSEVEMVEVAEPPWVTDTLDGEALNVKSGAAWAFTVRATVVVWVVPPPLAVTVTLDVPVAAVLLAVKVSVELPFPGAAIDVGLKVAVTPAGKPDAASVIAELNPPVAAVEIVVLALLPCVRDRLLDEALRLKSAAAPGLKTILSTGCNSIWLGAAPVCPWGKSNMPTPVTCTGMLAV